MRYFERGVTLLGLVLVCPWISLTHAAELPVKAPPATAKTASLGQGWEATLDEDTRYYSWSSSRPFPQTASLFPGKGSQTYAPFGLQITGKPVNDWNVEFLTRSGYVSSKQTSIGATGSVSTFTDTTISATAKYLGLNGLQPYASVAINAPSGKSALLGTQPFARLDSDFVAVGTFGEGFNIGPTAGVAVIVNNDLVLDYSLGYTSRGSYARDGMTNAATGLAAPNTPPNGISKLSPGDLTSFAANVAYRWNSITFRGTGSYVIEQTTFINGGALYKAGDRNYLALSALYAWDNGWTTTVAGNWTHQARQKVFNTVFFSPLVLEALNSNNDFFNVSVDHRFKWNSWMFGPTASYFHRDNNSWNPLTLTFVSAKTKWSAGGAAEVTATSNLSFNGRVERMWASQDPMPFVALPSISATGWLASLGGTYKF